MTQHKNVPCSLHIFQPSFTIIKWKLLSSVWLFVTPWTVVHGKNTGVGSHSLLQGIFPTQGSNQASRIVGRFFTIWAMKEAQEYWSG